MALNLSTGCLPGPPQGDDEISCAGEDHHGQAHQTRSFTPRPGIRSGARQVSATPCWNKAEVCQVLEARHDILLKRLEELMLAHEERQQKLMMGFMSSRCGDSSNYLPSPDVKLQSNSEAFQLQTTPELQSNSDAFQLVSDSIPTAEKSNSEAFQLVTESIPEPEAQQQKSETFQIHTDSMPDSEVITFKSSLKSQGAKKQVNFRNTSESGEPVIGRSSQKYQSLQDFRQASQASLPSCAHTSLRTYSLRTQEVITGNIKTMIRNPRFEIFFACMISSNALVLGVEVGMSSSPNAHSNVFYAIQIGYTAIFSLELLLRLLGHDGCLRFLFFSSTRAWNIFDTFVLICSFAETAISLALVGGQSDSVTRWVSVARVARLVRVLRILRIVRFIGPLRVLVVSIVSTLRSLFWAVTLLVIIIYMFAVLLAQAAAEHLNETSTSMPLQGDLQKLDLYWGSLPAAMSTLFLSISGGISWIEVISPLDRLGWIWCAVFTSFIVFSLFAVLNVMTGVFCESAISSAQKSYDVKWQSMMFEKQQYIADLKQIFDRIDPTDSGEVELDALHKYWQEDSMQSFFASLDLEPNDCWMFFTVLANHCEGGVKIEEFVDGCMRLKGTAKAFDVAVISLELRHLSSQLFDFMNAVEENLGQLSHLFRAASPAPRDESKAPVVRRKSRRGKTVTLLRNTS